MTILDAANRAMRIGAISPVASPVAKTVAGDGAPNDSIKRVALAGWLIIAIFFGGIGAWRADLKATGIAGRGWAWTAYDWDEGRVFNYIGDAQNTFPIWNATPILALDTYEHAYYIDYGTARGNYIDQFLKVLDWKVVEENYARAMRMHGK